MMAKDPLFVAWRLQTKSSDSLAELQSLLQPVASLSSSLSDRAITLQGGQEVVQERRLRFSDYFERLGILPTSDEDSPAIRLFFHRKPEADRFWKDLMSSVLKQARQLSSEVWVGLDYSVNDEYIHSVADHIPRWLRHIGVNSQKSWRISASYLLSHNRFTFRDLEAFSGIPEESLRAMHRNSYRAIKSEESPNPLWAKLDYGLGRNVYSMEPAVRDEFLCILDQDCNHW
jgi:hypothetical protein